MEWRDEGIILGTKQHGETSVIVELMTCAHGRHLGIVRGGRSRKMQPLLQLGNYVDVFWRARLDEHLGTWQIEPVRFSAARLIEAPVALYGLQLAATHLRLLPERDPYPSLFNTLMRIIVHFEDPLMMGELLLHFEVMMLKELGCGLDLNRCAATGSHEQLIYVSPKSGRAVSRDAGAPWKDKLLPIPSFVTNPHIRAVSAAEIKDSFHMTGYFLTRHVWEPRALMVPDVRSGFLSAIAKMTSTSSSY